MAEAPAANPNLHVCLVDGNTGRLDKSGWAEKQSIIRVSGLAHALGQDDLLINAIAAANAAGYTYGSEHPQLTRLYLLGDRTPKVLSSTSAEIEVLYRRNDVAYPSAAINPDYVNVRGGVALVTEKTNLDSNGNPIITSWKAAANADAIPQAGFVDVQTPCPTLEFSKLLTVCPIQYALGIVGCTNHGLFQGYAAGFWLCTGADYATKDSGQTWETTFRFTWNAKQWKQTVYYQIDTGKPPPNWNADYNQGNTLQVIQVYADSDFDLLGLPNVYQE